MPTSDDELRATIARYRRHLKTIYSVAGITSINKLDLTALLDAAERAQELEAALRLAWSFADPFNMPDYACETIRRALKEPTA